MPQADASNYVFYTNQNVLYADTDGDLYLTDHEQLINLSSCEQ